MVGKGHGGRGLGPRGEEGVGQGGGVRGMEDNTLEG